MYTFEVGEVEIYTPVGSDSSMIRVPVHVMDGKKVVETRNLGFDAEMDRKEIKKELNKFKESYIVEAEQKEKQKALDKAQDKTDKIKSELSGITI